MKKYSATSGFIVIQNVQSAATKPEFDVEEFVINSDDNFIVAFLDCSLQRDLYGKIIEPHNDWRGKFFKENEV